MNIVIKLTGRLFDDGELVAKYVNVMKSIDVKVGVVTGGGEIARRYIDIARRHGVAHTFQDLLGIYASRLNALLLVALLGADAYPQVARDVGEFLKAWKSHRIVVAGGFQPGQSTATVAALVAEAVGASMLLNAANVDAIYDDDPRKNPSAKKIPQLTYRQLEAVAKSSSLPGGYELMDLWSVAILERSCISTYIFDYRKPEYIFDILKGYNPGSRVVC